MRRDCHAACALSLSSRSSSKKLSVTPTGRLSAWRGGTISRALSACFSKTTQELQKKDTMKRLEESTFAKPEPASEKIWATCHGTSEGFSHPNSFEAKLNASLASRLGLKKADISSSKFVIRITNTVNSKSVDAAILDASEDVVGIDLSEIAFSALHDKGRINSGRLFKTEAQLMRVRR